MLLERARGGAGGLVLSGGGPRRPPPPRSGSGGPAITAEQGTLVRDAVDAPVAAGDAAPGPPDRGPARGAPAAAGHQRPTRRAASWPASGTGAARTTSTSTGPSSSCVEHPVPEEDDIIVRERVRTRRSVVLLADVSGSMRGERIRTAAATVGALAAELARDDLAVVAFWSDAAVLSHLGQHVPPQQLLDQMLRIPARGLTNIAFPLQVAARSWCLDSSCLLPPFAAGKTAA